MKDDTLHPAAPDDSPALTAFLQGLVFGFDHGTASLAYAFRHGSNYQDIGLLTFPDELGDLEGRGQHRRQRVGLDHKQERRDWFAKELARLLGLELHDEIRLPKTAWVRNDKGGWVPNEAFDKGKTNTLHDPVLLRKRAADPKEELKAEELFTALTHLFKRRGYEPVVPWSAHVDDDSLLALSGQEDAEDEAADEEENKPQEKDQTQQQATKEKEAQEREKTKARMMEVVEQMKSLGLHYPHELLLHLHGTRNDNDQPCAQRDLIWPRYLLVREYKTIIKAQRERFPGLKAIQTWTDVVGKAQRRSAMLWLLFGDVRFILLRVNEDGIRRRRVFAVYEKDTLRHEKKRHRVNPGILTLRAARIDNRHVGLDAARPYFEHTFPEGTKLVPNHVVRRSHPLYREWQFEVALANFRVCKLKRHDRNGKPKYDDFAPPQDDRDALIALWKRKGHVWEEDLRDWVKAYEGRFELREKQRDLTPRSFDGRARFSAAGMLQAKEALQKARAAQDKALEKAYARLYKKKIKDDAKRAKAIEKALKEQHAEAKADDEFKLAFELAKETAPAPKLRAPGEKIEDAIQKYIRSIRSPKVRLRVQFFYREFKRLLHDHCPGALDETKPLPPEKQPFIVVEMARDIMMSKDAKKEADTENKKRQKEKQAARAVLRGMGVSESDVNIKKLKLANEAGWKCPFKLVNFTQADFDKLEITKLVKPWDEKQGVQLTQQGKELAQSLKPNWPSLTIEHLVPQAEVVCNDWCNLTVTFASVNMAKGNRTPFEAWHGQGERLGDKEWAEVEKNARERFGPSSEKYRIFTSPDARKLVRERCERPLKQTAEIARRMRHVVLIRMNWLDAEGRDPTGAKEGEPGHIASTHYLPTYGGLTARIRSHWKLNDLLHPPLEEEPKRLTDEDKQTMNEEELQAHEKKRKEWWEKFKAHTLKNRQDLRHHVLDAMIVAATYPSAVFQVTGSHFNKEVAWCEADANKPDGIKRIYCPLLADYGQKFREMAKAKLEQLLENPGNKHQNRIRHHQPSQRHLKSLDSMLYGKRGSGKDTVYVARKPLLELTEGHLKDEDNTGGYVYSDILRKYIREAWQNYKAKPEHWLQVRDHWLKSAQASLQAAQEAVQTANDDQDKRKATAARKSVKAAQDRIDKLDKLTPHDWNPLLEYVDQEANKPDNKPKALLPVQFIETLRHPVYQTPVTNVKVTAQSADAANFIEVKPHAAKARSSTYLLRKGGNKFRELRIYSVTREVGTKVRTTFESWFVLPFYRAEDGEIVSWRSKRFKQEEKLLMPNEVRKRIYDKQDHEERVTVEPLATIRKGQVYSFKSRPAKAKDTDTERPCLDLMWRVVSLQESRNVIEVVRAHQNRTTLHPITRKEVKAESIELSINQFMKCLTHEPDDPSAESATAGEAET